MILENLKKPGLWEQIISFFKTNIIKELIEYNEKLQVENKELEEYSNYARNQWNIYYDISKKLNTEKVEILNEKDKLENLLIQRDKIIDELKLENLNLKEELKKENPNWKIEADSAWRINEELKKENPNWKIEADSAWRINPVTGEREEYIIPYDFDKTMVRDLNFTKNGTARKFKHYDKSEPGNRRGEWKFYEIPVPLYDQLSNKKSKYKYLPFEKEIIISIKKIDDLKNQLDEKGLKFKGKYSENVYKFIIENIGKSFTTKEFIKNCQFNNRESARQKLQILQEYQVIRKFGRGIYKVII